MVGGPDERNMVSLFSSFRSQREIKHFGCDAPKRDYTTETKEDIDVFDDDIDGYKDKEDKNMQD
jgi:hypothetical protein